MLFCCKVWRVEDSELVEVDERALGVFFGGDSYVIKYEYEKNNKPQFIIYFWQVRNTFLTPFLSIPKLSSVLRFIYTYM